LSAKQRRRSAIGPSEGFNKHTPAAGFQEDSEVGLQGSNFLVQRNDGRVFIFSTNFLGWAQDLAQEKLISLLSTMQRIMFVTP
jgi:hypothetical protein